MTARPDDHGSKPAQSTPRAPGADALNPADWIEIVRRLKDIIERELTFLAKPPAKDASATKARADAIRHFDVLVRAIERVRIIHDELIDKGAAPRGEGDAAAMRADLERRLARLAERGHKSRVPRKSRRGGSGNPSA